mmetsp:Transcript_28069/g.59254  ORF Transcript_28069/g.59254 Transcript_28069/m.59254 type:complete len:479 (+) Transcript_28069:336-1772(+)
MRTSVTLLALLARTLVPCNIFSTIPSPSCHFADAFNAPAALAIKRDYIIRGASKSSRLEVATESEFSSVITSTTSRPEPIIQRTRFQGILAIAAITTAASNGLHFQSIPVAESLLALVASIVIVSGATDAMERVTAAYGNVPSYSVSGERFSQSSFAGRFSKMLLACDPRLLLYTEEEVRKYHAIAYEDWKAIKAAAVAEDGDSDEMEIDRMLWNARRISDSGLNPETQEWIPRPFRMSGYLPFNGPICIAMISVTATSPLLFWSWMNQSQNALVNDFNGPKTKSSGEYDSENSVMDGTLVKSYGIAIVSALSVAFGLATYVKSNYSGEEAESLLRFISFPSAVIASSLNCYVVRSPEIETGVPLLNENMKDVLPGETSIAAARKGVYSTTASRAVLQMPTYFIPPLILDTITPLKQFLNENPSLVVPMTTFLLLLSFGIGLPMAVGLFPQVSSVKVEDVEDKFAQLGCDELYYNKGL